MSDSDHKQYHYGGQAVIEGVMMRGPKDFTVAVRRLDGEIITSTEDVDSILGRLKWLNKPFLRGTLALIDSLALGIKALMFSADVAMQMPTEGQPDPAEAPKSDSKVNNIAIGASMVLGLALAIGLFVLVPIAIASRFALEGWEKTAVAGGIKIVVFAAYVLLISLLPDIRRVFQYHGAEHKTINAYEDKVDLTVENVEKYTKVHVRCGTSFILVVLVVSIIVLMAVPWGHGLLGILRRFGIELLLLPLIAGISYEVIRLAGNKKGSMLTKIVLAPGLLMQKVTTREPDPAMIEVAIASLKGVLDKENVREA